MGFPVLVTKFQGTPLCHQGQFAYSYVVGEKSYQASLVSGKYRSKCWLHILVLVTQPWEPLVHGAALVLDGKATAFVPILPAKSGTTQTETLL